MEFFKKLLSRKLIIAVAGAVYFIGSGDVNQALALILAYMGIEGMVDISGRLAARK